MEYEINQEFVMMCLTPENGQFREELFIVEMLVFPNLFKLFLKLLFLLNEFPPYLNR